jgi:magnesium transporter
MIQYLRGDNNFTVLDKWEGGCWINVINPTKDEREMLSSTFNVPDYFLIDIQDIEERPRIDRDEGWMLTIIQVPVREKDEDGDFIYSTVPLGILFKDDIFLTVYYKENEVIHSFIRWKKQRNIEQFNNYNLYLSLFFEMVFWYLKYLKQIHIEMKKSEEILDKSMNQDEIQRIMYIEKFLIYFISAMRDNETVLMRVKRYFQNIKYDQDILEDSEVELHQAITSATIYSNIIEHQQTTYSSLINNNLNKTMKNLTVITICLMCAALVPGFFGMNLVNGMETSNYGFAFALVLTCMAALIGYYIFKKIYKIL